MIDPWCKSGVRLNCGFDVKGGLECVLWGDINGGVEEVDTFGRACYFKFDGGVKRIEVLNE